MQKNTRRACYRAITRFFAWCDKHKIGQLVEIEPPYVWDHRAGLASLREQVESADSAERKAAMRLARTKPTTPAGAGALIAYVLQRERMYGGFEGWEIRALKTVAGALAKMEAA
jgi:hypothetical protein